MSKKYTKDKTIFITSLSYLVCVLLPFSSYLNKCGSCGFIVGWNANTVHVQIPWFCILLCPKNFYFEMIYKIHEIAQKCLIKKKLHDEWWYFMCYMCMCVLFPVLIRRMCCVLPTLNNTIVGRIVVINCFACWKGVPQNEEYSMNRQFSIVSSRFNSASNNFTQYNKTHLIF